MADISEITIESYMADPEHKELADRILAAGHLKPEDCYHIERHGDAWLCHCYRKRGTRVGVNFDRTKTLRTTVKVAA